MKIRMNSEWVGNRVNPVKRVAKRAAKRVAKLVYQLMEQSKVFYAKNTKL